MRSKSLLLCLLVGCGGITASGGETRAKYAGTQSLVFTNATPDTMCELHMTYDGETRFGDNWLPVGGLPSGKSIEFKVRAGKYMATWNTCKPKGDRRWFAGTLTGDTAFQVGDSTQLFAYVADKVAPTKRALPLPLYVMVKFSGQPIGGPVEPAVDEPPAKPTKVEVVATKPDKVDASQWVDKKAAKQSKKKGALKPSVARGHDIASSKVGYKAR
jgi:hypothetical protein